MKNFWTYVFGGSPQVKLLSFLINNIDGDYTLSELSKKTNTGYSTLKIIIPKLLKKNIIIIKRNVGKIKFYKLNKNSQHIKYLINGK